MRRQEVLYPTCNMTTITDGRGGVFSWVPEDAIVEFNMLYFNPGATRGNHYHPEFNEYVLVVAGEGIMVSKDSEGGEKKIIHMSKGSCVRTPSGVIHTFYAISPVTAIAMLSKKWDDCTPPIVRVDVNA